MVDIDFDRRERKHQRLWWNKVIGLVVFGPVGLALAAAVLFVPFLITMVLSKKSGSNQSNVLAFWIVMSVPALFPAWYAIPMPYRWWLRLMKDEDD